MGILDGGTLVAEARPVPVSLAEAEEGCRHYRGAVGGEVGHCFVCGRAREDVLGIFAGPVPGRTSSPLP